MEGIAAGFLLFFPYLVLLFIFIRRKKFLKEPPTSLWKFIKQQLIFSIFFVLSLAALTKSMLDTVISSREFMFNDASQLINLMFLVLIILPFISPMAIDSAIVLLGFKPLNYIKKLGVFLFLYVCVFYIHNAYSDVNYIMNFKESDSHKDIYFNDGSVIYGNPSKFYIGNTSQYLFVFDKDKTKSSMYPMKDIKRIDF